MRLLFDRQGAVVSHCPPLTERHRAPNGVPAQAKTWVGDERTQSPVTVAPPAAPYPTPLRSTAGTHISQPKKLSERLQWMADNLPGFREEMELVDDIQRRARLRGG